MRVEMEGKTPIKLWTTSPQGDVPVEDKALAQLRNIARLPFVFRHVAAMPDVHLGTLGTGNHFIELGLDELDRVWVMRRFAVLTVKG